MKKYLKLESLIRAEVPQDLDLRILAAAKMRRGASLRRRKLRLVLSGTAAAAAVCIAAGLSFMPQTRQNSKNISSEEYSSLMAMADWTNIEQENYNLSGEINSGSSQLAEFAENRIFSGV